MSSTAIHRPEEIPAGLSPNRFIQALEHVQKVLDQDSPCPDDWIYVTVWARQLMDQHSPLGRLYRAFGKDPETDLMLYLQRLPERPADKPYELVRASDCRKVWRFLMRRYAWLDSARVIRKLLKVDGIGWNLYRAASFFLPRLWLAIIVGYLAVVSSDGLLRLMTEVARSSRTRVLWTTLALLLSFFLGLAEVERRVGRHAKKLLLRSLLLFASGIVSATLLWFLGLARVWVTGLKQAPLPEYGEFVFIVAALAIGHIVQLFWQEGSVGDPL